MTAAPGVTPAPTATWSAGPANGHRLRHGFLAAALLVVAALRLGEGDLPWATVLGAAGLLESALAVAARRASGTSTHQDLRAAGHQSLPGSAVERSLVGHRRNVRLWLSGLLLCTAAAASVLTSTPALAIVLAVLGLFSLHRMRRARRSVAVLQRLAGAGRLSSEGRG